MSTQLAQFLPQRKDYDRRTFRSDVLAGITVAFVALPLAMGFGVTSGAGAAAGLATAVVAGVLAAVFGGSNFQVSGPTGAMTVVLLPLVARYGVGVLAPVGVVAGLLLVLLSAARVGRLVRFIPYPVVTGFTIGIAVIIFLQQLPEVLGLPRVEGEQILLVTWRLLSEAPGQVGWEAPLIAALTAGVMISWDRLERLPRFVPPSMTALLALTAMSMASPFEGLHRVGSIPAGLLTFQLPGNAGIGISELVRAALVIALLAALESLMSAVVADGMTAGERHDSDRELFGQGIANIGSALFGGIPATAALARTAVNVRSGARTRLAAIVHGLVLAAIVLALAPLAERIPLAVLAGILCVVAIRMLEVDEFRQILRSTKSDAATMLLTLGVTVAFDLILAIEVGLVVAGALFVTRMSRLFQVDLMELDHTGRAGPGDEGPTSDVPARTDDLVVYRIDGPVFFGAADRFFEELLRVDHGIRAVVLRMHGVPVMDVTGATALRTLVERLDRRDILVLISGLQEQPRQVLDRTGILPMVTRRGDHLFDGIEEAVAHARLHLERGDHLSPAHDQAGDSIA